MTAEAETALRAGREEELTNNLVLIPYRQGERTLRDDYMRCLWRRAKDERLLHRLYGGKGVDSFAEFLSLIDRQDQAVFVVSGKSSPRIPIVLVILHHWDPPRSVEAGGLVFRGHHGPGSVAIGKWLLGQIFRLTGHGGEFVVNAVTARIDQGNSLAVRYAMALGLKDAGIDQDTGMATKIITREDWQR